MPTSHNTNIKLKHSVKSQYSEIKTNKKITESVINKFYTNIVFLECLLSFHRGTFNINSISTCYLKPQTVGWMKVTCVACAWGSLFQVSLLESIQYLLSSINLILQQIPYIVFMILFSCWFLEVAAISCFLFKSYN